jgi:serine phosphatase RsbU (regulator of sigma subunit)
MRNIVVNHREQPANTIAQQIIRETQKFSDSEIYLDDFTLVVIKKTE